MKIRVFPPAVRQALPCRLAFLPPSYRRRPDGNFARPAGLFLLHPNGLNRKPFFDDGILGAPSSILSRLLIEPMCRNRGSICPVLAMVDPSLGEHAPDRPRREILLDSPYVTLSHVPSSEASVAAAGE